MDFGTDDNNNTSGEKSYSLRPRASSKRDRDDQDEEETWRPRSRARKRQKQKSAPLSKYRRKTANARERSRMREINDAFEALRRAIPHLPSSSDSNNEKTSKIMTLRLAMKYITALSNALEEPESYSVVDIHNNMTLLDNSSSTSSISDHVSWRDQMFSSTPPLETTSSVGSPLSCTVRNFEPINVSSSTLLPQGVFTKYLDKFPGSSSNVTAVKHFLPCTETRLPELSRHTLTPPDEQSFNLPHFEDFTSNQLCSSSNDLQAPTLFNTDFDGLPSPVMDFCDLFIT